MTSFRNIAFLVLTAGIGLGAYLMVKGPLLKGHSIEEGRGKFTIEVTAEQGPRTRSGSPAAAADAVDLVDVDEPNRGSVGDSSDGGPVGSTVIWPLEIDLTMTLDGRIDVPEGAQRLNWGAKAGIKGSIHGSSGHPVPGKVEFLYGPNEGRILQTGSDGKFGASNLLPGISVARVSTADGSAVEREVQLTSRTHREFHISFAGPSYIAGTVKDERGVVIEGAEVRLDGHLRYTNADGVFTFRAVPPGSAHVSVRKEGFAHCSQNVGVGHRQTVLAKNFVIVMKQGARLQISLNRTVGAPEASLAYLMPAAGPGRTSNGRSFPWHEINPVRIPLGGTAIVEGLPLDSVNVRVFHRGAVAKPESKNVRLHKGRQNAVAIDLLPAPTIRGLVLDQGKVAAGATVQIQASDRAHATSRSMRQKGPLFASSMVVTTVPAAFNETRTDGKGNFLFTSLPDLITTYYATATSRDGLRRGVSVIEPGATKITVRLEPIEEKVGALEIALPGRFQGLPVQVSVNGQPAEPYMLRPGRPLLIEDLPLGHWDVGARWRGADVVLRQDVVIKDGLAEIRGTLPEGAIQGQTEEVRSRALKAQLITLGQYGAKPR